ncbi:2-C-methyl-D-erythritol 4-phosphate cytidylyltransferase [Flavobacteriales bacterium]|nr:2-C-methyl-D-erythritol 4-phosphate cytidylyltransferase [Flavobacteriales bacterium]
MDTINHYVIIVAGGAGKRMNSPLPKQFIEIHNKPIIFHTIEKFLAADSTINFVISLHLDFVDYWKELLEKHQFNFKHEIVVGGEERFFSVNNALELVPSNSIVGIHDAVRPLVSKETILNCFKTAQQEGSAIPVVDSVNSVRFIQKEINQNLERQYVKQVQTPQYFSSKLIKDCYLTDYSRKFTDDASVFEAKNSAIITVDGNPENIKITSPIDLIIAKELLK